jgi:hypothetical protein
MSHDFPDALLDAVSQYVQLSDAGMDDAATKVYMTAVAAHGDAAWDAAVDHVDRTGWDGRPGFYGGQG